MNHFLYDNLLYVLCQNSLAEECVVGSSHFVPSMSSMRLATRYGSALLYSKRPNLSPTYTSVKWSECMSCSVHSSYSQQQACHHPPIFLF